MAFCSKRTHRGEYFCLFEFLISFLLFSIFLFFFFKSFCVVWQHLFLYRPSPAHLVNFVACRAGCHERWDEFDPPHGPPRVLPEPPRWPLVDPVGPPDDCGCHGAQRFGHAPWFHAHDQPPISFFLYHFVDQIRFFIWSKMKIFFWFIFILTVGVGVTTENINGEKKRKVKK